MYSFLPFILSIYLFYIIVETFHFLLFGVCVIFFICCINMFCFLSEDWKRKMEQWENIIIEQSIFHINRFVDPFFSAPFISSCLYQMMMLLSARRSTVRTPQWYFPAKGTEPVHCEPDDSLYSACTELNGLFSVQTAPCRYQRSRAPAKCIAGFFCVILNPLVFLGSFIPDFF